MPAVGTKSDVFGGEGAGKQRRPEPVLYVVLCGNQPLAASSQHLLGAVDVVRFGRGEPGASRERVGGERHLVIRVPDPTMSSDHGRVLAVPGGWWLDDP